MILLSLGVLFVVAAIIAKQLPAQEDEKAFKKGAVWALFVIAGLLIIGSQVAIVGTKKVGVVTTFNKPVGTMDNGLHHKWPWQKVHELDGAIQTDNHLCNGGPEAPGTGILARIGNQSVACMDVNVRWRIKQQHADALFRDYRGFDHIRDSLVTRDLTKSVNAAFSDYNPLGNLSANSGAPVPALDEFGETVREALINDIGDQIEVLSVFIPIVHHDKQTQSKINQYQAAKADTRIALQKVQTAQNDAKANKALADSISKDPNVLVSKCLDLVNKGVALPAGFTCWPGGGNGVVIPGGGK
jgi:regulator of protease activity HflC (stomatin/prohibitin superfamily)